MNITENTLINGMKCVYNPNKKMYYPITKIVAGKTYILNEKTFHYILISNQELDPNTITPQQRFKCLKEAEELEKKEFPF